MSKIVVINEGLDTEKIVYGDSFGYPTGKHMLIVTSAKKRVYSMRSSKVESVEVKDE